MKIQLQLTLLSSLFLFSSCCGPALRTAQTLDKGEFEVSGGLVAHHFRLVRPTVIGAYGVTDRLELEARYENLTTVNVGPRYQLYDGGRERISAVGFAQVGIDPSVKFTHQDKLYPTVMSGGGLTLGMPFSGGRDLMWTVAGRAIYTSNLMYEGSTGTWMPSFYTGIGFRSPVPNRKQHWGFEIGGSFPGGIQIGIDTGFKF